MTGGDTAWLRPHPEEQPRGCVSKEDPESTGDALALRDASLLRARAAWCDGARAAGWETGRGRRREAQPVGYSPLTAGKDKGRASPAGRRAAQRFMSRTSRSEYRTPNRVRRSKGISRRSGPGSPSRMRFGKEEIRFHLSGIDS